ncbi:PREDICTED: uncharacterized protein LOC108445318 isoform X2 [Corvus brachyrhynchos]|uniref:uncharacterized protein LOC108445318 isoform X2 n=1 Tax=Corvus brachyrhynchos TaxID=85066 RepID=UPI0008164FEE|nr:PREDICTED: uncharacterized protein LOC108445318 isoform X2 [Corvus brachyrhynchos]
MSPLRGSQGCPVGALQLLFLVVKVPPEGQTQRPQNSEEPRELEPQNQERQNPGEPRHPETRRAGAQNCRDPGHQRAGALTPGSPETQRAGAHQPIPGGSTHIQPRVRPGGSLTPEQTVACGRCDPPHLCQVTMELCPGQPQEALLTVNEQIGRVSVQPWTACVSSLSLAPAECPCAL